MTQHTNSRRVRGTGRRIIVAGAALGVCATTVVVAQSASTASAATPVPTKVMEIVLENHSGSQAMSSMPYLVSQAKTYGYTTNYKAITHPSLPNYLALTAGSTFGKTSNPLPSNWTTSSTPSLFGQVIKAGKTAKTYAETKPSNCYLKDSGTYVVHHNPWAYFSGERTQCQKYDVPMGTTSSGALKNDVANGLPNYSLVVPNKCNDGHDCSLSTADNWVKKWLAVIMNGADYKNNRLVVVVTFDEDDKSSGNVVLTTVIAPWISHVVSGTSYTHYSLVRLVDDLFGLPELRSGSGAPNMRPAFHLRPRSCGTQWPPAPPVLPAATAASRHRPHYRPVSP